MRASDLAGPDAIASAQPRLAAGVAAACGYDGGMDDGAAFGGALGTRAAATRARLQGLAGLLGLAGRPVATLETRAVPRIRRPRRPRRPGVRTRR